MVRWLSIALHVSSPFSSLEPFQGVIVNFLTRFISAYSIVQSYDVIKTTETNPTVSLNQRTLIS
jgi:hypothetical protein